MGLFDRWRRGTVSTPEPVEGRAIDWPFDVGPPAYGSGVTADTALALAPVFAAVRLLADSVASLPLQAYRATGDERVKVPLPQLFRQPSAHGTLYDWLHSCMTSLLLHGNAYGLITGFDGYGYPTGIEWLNPGCVRLDESTGTLRYFYEGREVSAERIFHVRGFTLPGCCEGLSPVRQFATLIGSGIAADRYSSDWFENGGIPPGKFKNSEQKVDPKSADEITARLVNKIRGRKPLVYGKDWDYEPISIPPRDIAFIETMQLKATQVASIYGIPPERIGGSRGDSMTYSTDEMDDIAFTNRALRPWLERLEAAFFAIVPASVFVKFNIDAHLRVDTLTRYQVFRIAREIGLRSVNELRALEDLDPIEGGDDARPLAELIADAKPDPAPPAGQPALPPARPRAVS